MPLTIVTWAKDRTRRSVPKHDGDYVLHRPERRLHPGEYIDEARRYVRSAQQLNIVVYTLDEVLFNAYRVAIKEANKGQPYNNCVAVLMFYDMFVGGDVKYKEQYRCQIDTDGRCDRWVGFNTYEWLLRQLI